jgi:hypothetical protein
MNRNQAWIAVVALVILFAIGACSINPAAPSKDGVQPSSPTPKPTATLPVDAPVVAAGSPFVEQVSAQVNVPAGESGTAVAACPSGSLTLAGGFGSAAGMQITKTMPDPSGWLVSGQNGSTETIILEAYAVCLHNDNGTARVVSAQVPLSGAPIAWCEQNERVTGGGFAAEAGVEVYISTPIGMEGATNGWSLMARSSQNPDQPISIYAVCLAGSSLTTSFIIDQVSFLPGSDYLSFTLVCPAGSLLATGGYEGTAAYISRISATDANLWEVQVQGKNFTDGSLDHAVCLHLP